MSKPTIYIIGAGIAGLSAAYSLLENGCKVKIFESSKYFGGRLRSYHDDKLATKIDNGNHLIMGANQAVLKLLEKLSLFKNFNYFNKGKFSFFNTKTLTGFEIDKLNLSNITDANIFNLASLFNFALTHNRTVADIFGGKTANNNPVFKNYFDVVSKSILNTNSFAASATLLRNVILKLITTKDSFDYYYPKTNWDEALITPLVERIKAKGGEIYLNKPLKRLHTEADKVIELIFTENSEIIQPEDSVIIATQAHIAKNLVEGLVVPEKYNPIVNVHFKIASGLPAQMFALLDSDCEWVFVKPEIISTTTSDASKELMELDESELASSIWKDVAEYLNLKNVSMPPYRIITEKRATISADIENLKLRPSNKTDYDNLYLAGDYTSSNLPATIESAIQSSNKTVNYILSEIKK